MPLGTGPRLSVGAILTLVGFSTTPLSAQHAPAPGSPEARRPDAPPPSDPESIERLFGAEPPESLVGVDDEMAIRRLGSLETSAALEQLAELASEPGNLSERALLLLTRALSRRATEAPAVRALQTVLTRAGNDSGSLRMGPLLGMAREQAALGLALGGTDEGVSVLARMVKRGHEDGELALRALVAHPPRDIGPVLDGPGAPNVTFAALLERLGDQRAFVPLREMVRRGTPEVKARAALALTRLGHLETVELAHHWLAQSHDLEQRAAAAEILLQVGDPEAAKAWQWLHGAAPGRALVLATALPSEALVARIVKLPEPVSGDWLLPLGHAGGDLAITRLGRELQAGNAPAAAYALARCPDERAGTRLERALDSDRVEVKRLAAQALVVRAFLYAGSTESVESALRAFTKSTSSRDRFIGHWGRAALDSEHAISGLESKSLLTLSAVMATASVQSSEFFERAARLLGKETDVRRRELLALVLLDERARRNVPSDDLRTWILADSPLRSLAIRALSERDDPRHATLLRSLLGATDVATRAATALGLGGHPAPLATGLLVGAYDFEASAEVRLAVVVALSQRAATSMRDEALTAARDVDVDSRVRAAARLALAGQPLRPEPFGSEVAWVTIADGPVPDWVVATVSAAPNLPVPTGGQRVLPVLGVASADVRVRLAPRGATGDDARRDAREEKRP